MRGAEGESFSQLLILKPVLRETDVHSQSMLVEIADMVTFLAKCIKVRHGVSLLHVVDFLAATGFDECEKRTRNHRLVTFARCQISRRQSALRSFCLAIIDIGHPT